MSIPEVSFSLFSFSHVRATLPFSPSAVSSNVLFVFSFAPLRGGGLTPEMETFFSETLHGLYSPSLEASLCSRDSKWTWANSYLFLSFSLCSVSPISRWSEWNRTILLQLRLQPLQPPLSVQIKSKSSSTLSSLSRHSVPLDLNLTLQTLHSILPTTLLPPLLHFNNRFPPRH